MGGKDDEWDGGHEVAAKERLFEIGLERMRMFGLAEVPTAVRLADRATATEREFASSLENVARMTRAQVAIEVAHVRLVVARRIADVESAGR